MVQCLSGCGMPRSGLAAAAALPSKAGAPRATRGSSAPRAAPAGFWGWHRGTGWITLTHQSCRGAQQGDKCSAKHREAKTEDVEEKRTFTFFTWRSKINMGTLPRRRACCGVDAELRLLPVRICRNVPVCSAVGARAPQAPLSHTGQGHHLLLTFEGQERSNSENQVSVPWLLFCWYFNQKDSILEPTERAIFGVCTAAAQPARLGRMALCGAVPRQLGVGSSGWAPGAAAPSSPGELRC